MEKFIKDNSEKLENIFRGFLDNSVIKDDSVKLEYNIILRDLYDVNSFLNMTYLIFRNSEIDDEKKAELIFNFRDSYGNKLLTKEQSRQVVRKYKKPLTEFFDKAYTRLFMKQTGGAVTKTITKTEADDVIKKAIKLETNKIINGNSIIADDDDQYSTYSDIYDWMFHPLWKLENNKHIGFLFPVPLDIIGSVIDAVNLINPFLMVIFSKVIASLGTAAASGLGGVAGTAIGALFVGVGAAVGAPLGPVITSTIWPAIGQPILIWVLEHYIDFISMFYNISRKNVGLAYLNALDGIPYFEVILDFVIKRLLRVNKKLGQIYPVTTTIRAGTEMTSNIIQTILENPSALLNVKTFYKIIIKRNIRKLPQFKNLSDEQLEEFEKQADNIYDLSNKSINCILNKKDKLIENSNNKQSNVKEISECFPDLRTALLTKINKRS